MSSLDIPQVSTLAGFYTLFYKEWLRFWKVSIQTVLAPVLTALLFLLVFGHTLRNSLEPYPGVAYSIFLVPGLAMMSILQNAFANASSSLTQSKMTGNIVFVLQLPSGNLCKPETRMHCRQNCVEVEGQPTRGNRVRASRSSSTTLLRM